MKCPFCNKDFSDYLRAHSWYVLHSCPACGRRLDPPLTYGPVEEDGTTQKEPLHYGKLEENQD